MVNMVKKDFEQQTEFSPEGAIEQEVNPEKRGKGEILESFINKGSRLYADARNLISSTLDRINPARVEKRNLRENLAKYQEATKDRRQMILNYRQGEGVAAMVVKKTTEGQAKEKTPFIEARGFIDCCGVVLQSKEGLGIVHISPTNVYEADQYPGVDLYMEVQKSNYAEHLAATLKTMCGKENEDDGWPSDYRGLIIDPQNEQESHLSIEEISKMQDSLKISIIGGDRYLAGVLKGTFERGWGTGAGGDKINLPQIKPDVYYCGGGDKDIIATEDPIFVRDNTARALYQPGAEEKWTMPYSMSGRF